MTYPQSPQDASSYPTQTPWWQGAVLYQVYLRSFMDSNGDGIGDLPGITQKLDHIATLGVVGIWISPFFKSPMRDFGYDVEDYCAVDPMFGELDDFLQLLSEAHKRKLKVLIDLVPCHTSDQHDWFKESRRNRENPKANWYIWADPAPDGLPPNNWLSVFGGPAWHWDSRRSQYYYHAFLPEQPNLNFHCPEVLHAMLDAVTFWFDHGVDGLRIDAITSMFSDPTLRSNPPAKEELHYEGSHSNPFRMQQHLYDRDGPIVLTFLEQLRQLTDRYEGRVLMAEVADIDGPSTSAKYTNRSRLHTTYNFELLSPDFDLSRFRKIIERTQSLLGNEWITWTTGNHDVSRVVSRWGNSVHPKQKQLFAKLVLAWLLSLRGAICLYQGEELGLPQAEVPFKNLKDPFGLAFYPEYQGRDGCRTPIPWTSANMECGFTKGTPWLPLDQTHRALAVDLQASHPNSVLNAYRRLIHWRRSQPVLRLGAMKWLDLSLPAIKRSLNHLEMICLFNFSEEPIKIRVEPEFRSVDGHGFESYLEENQVVIPAYNAYFAIRT
jgi:alpha-glucosidase